MVRHAVAHCPRHEKKPSRGRPTGAADAPTVRASLRNCSPLLAATILRRGSETLTLVPPRPALSTRHIDTLYAAALAGMGIAGLPSFVVADALLEHALERVLPRWRLFHTSLYAAMPTRKHVPARTRAFIDFLVNCFGGEDRDPWLIAAGCETVAEQPAPGVAGAH